MVQVDLAICIIVRYVEWQCSEAKNYWKVMELCQILQNQVEYWFPIKMKFKIILKQSIT